MPKIHVFEPKKMLLNFPKKKIFPIIQKFSLSSTIQSKYKICDMNVSIKKLRLVCRPIYRTVGSNGLTG